MLVMWCGRHINGVPRACKSGRTPRLRFMKNCFGDLGQSSVAHFTKLHLRIAVRRAEAVNQGTRIRGRDVLRVASALLAMFICGEGQLAHWMESQILSTWSNIARIIRATCSTA